MKKFILATVTAACLGGVGLASAPASAAVVGPAPGLSGTPTIETVQMTRRHRMMRHNGVRPRAMRRPRMMRSDPNARNPSRPGYQQQQGNTTGGPRY